MHLELDNKIVLVTGGTKGIGREIVKAFLDEGATTHFCARNESDIKAANENLASDFPKAKAIGAVVDLSDEQQLKSWVDSCAEQSGGIDVIVANASALNVQDTTDAWKSMFQIDMLGLHIMAQTALPYLEKSKGNIVAIASVSGRDIDLIAPGPYGPSKAAMIHYTASLAHSLAPKGVRANTCSPGNIYTKEGTWGGIERDAPEVFKKQLDLNPMGRLGKPEEIANAVLFLASEKASFVSGSNFVVDGALCTGVQF